MLFEESGAERVRAHLAENPNRTSSSLLAVELQRAAARRSASARAEMILARISLITLDEDVLHLAERIAPAKVATLDAIHLATAVRLHEAGLVEAALTYDDRLVEGLEHHGIPVLSP